MKKLALVSIVILILGLLSACGTAALEPTPTLVKNVEPTEVAAVPTATPDLTITFVSPQDGSSLDYDSLTFEINPLPGAEGYSWSFIQNGQVLWETIKNEQRLRSAAYSVAPVGGLVEKFSSGELQVQVSARVKGQWTEPGSITVILPERVPTPTPTSVPTATLPPPAEGEVEIRWFVGLGTGTDANSQAIQRNVVRDFNAAHPDIKLTLQVVEYNQARDILREQIKSGTAPDIVGPMGWFAATELGDIWFDLSALVVDTGYDLSGFDPQLVASYQTDQGQVALPFAVYPAAVFYNRGLFDRAGLAYPPSAYGDPYTLPDGSQVEWSWDTLVTIARLLTIDVQGRDATDPDFDREHISQYGFIPQWQNATTFAAFWGADKLYDDHKNAVIPPAWGEAWAWYYDGIWGEQPFIPSQEVLNSDHLNYNNAFSSPNVAMATAQSWYIGPDVAGKQAWDLGALPSYQGQVHGRIDADTFRLWEGTPHPREAFEVLTYLVGEASPDLLRAYGGIPARTADQDPFFAARAQQYSFVKHWDVLRAGLNYPDIPSAEGYMPNFIDAWNRLQDFWNQLGSNDTLSVEAEIDRLRIDLDGIFK